MVIIGAWLFVRREGALVLKGERDGGGREREGGIGRGWREETGGDNGWVKEEEGIDEWRGGEGLRRAGREGK